MTCTEDAGYEIFSTAHMSVTERLLACLRNETMTDVALVGDDGIPVPACRYILGSASSVFQPLLYGNVLRKHNPQQSCTEDSSTVTIRASNQKSLTALVEFCCSDELNTSIWCDAHPLEIVQDTVALAKLAHTYEIPKLQQCAKDFLHPLMLAYPPLACNVFNLADAVATPDICESALAIIEEQSVAALQSSSSSGSNHKGKGAVSVGGMTCFSPEKLEEIMADNDIEADELFLFQQLVHWRDVNARRYKNVNAICKSVVRHLDMSSIDPNEIENTVMKSGFVDAAMLVKALMAQAKSATHEGLAFASLQGPRGRKFAHVLVQNAGDEECNGVYVHVKNNKDATNSGVGHLSYGAGSSINNHLYFVKRPDGAGDEVATKNSMYSTISGNSTKRAFVLVQDKDGAWRICDSYKNILYEWEPSSGNNSNNNKGNFPHKGWTAVAGENPAPECSWLRPHNEGSKTGHSTETTVSSCSNNSLGSNQGVAETTNPRGMLLPPNPTTPGAQQKLKFGTYSNRGISPSRPMPKEKPPSSPKSMAKKLSDKISQQNPLDVIDSAIATNAAKMSKKEKKKAARMTSLMDDEAKEDISVTDNVLLARRDSNMADADPILGTTIGGDGFVPESDGDAKEPPKKPPSEQHDVQKLPAAMPNKTMCGGSVPSTTSTTTMNNSSSARQSAPTACILPSPSGEPMTMGGSLPSTATTARMTNHSSHARNSAPTACILPSSSGEPVLVGCTHVAGV